MAPVGDRQTPDAQSAECRLRPPHGSEGCCPDNIGQRRQHVGGGLACTTHGTGARLHTGKGLLIQQKNRAELYIPSCFLLFV